MRPGCRVTKYRPLTGGGHSEEAHWWIRRRMKARIHGGCWTDEDQISCQVKKVTRKRNEKSNVIRRCKERKSRWLLSYLAFPTHRHLSEKSRRWEFWLLSYCCNHHTPIWIDRRWGFPFEHDWKRSQWPFLCRQMAFANLVDGSSGILKAYLTRCKVRL